MAEEFDPDKYLTEKTAMAVTPEFDPDQYLEEKTNPAIMGVPNVPTKSEPSLMSKIGSGVGQWASNSAARFKEGYVKPVTDVFDPNKSLPIAKGIPFLGEAAERGGAALGSLAATNIYPRTGTYEENFNKLLGDQHARENAYEEANPKTSMALELGAGGTMPVPPSAKAAEGAGLATRAGVGAVNAAGRVGSNAALSAGDAYVKGQDPVRAGLEGGVMAAGLEGLGGGAGLARNQLQRGQVDAELLSNYLKDLAEKKAFKAAVGNQAKPYAEAAAKGQINARGRDLLDSGVVGFGSSAQTIADRAKVQKSVAGSDIQDILKQVDERAAGAVSGKEIADSIRARAQKIAGKGNETTVKALEDAAQHYEELGDHAMSLAQIEKNSWKYKPGKDFEVNNIVKGAVGDAMDAGVGRAASQRVADTSSGFGEMLQTGSGRSVPTGSDGSVLREAQSASTPPLDEAYQNAKSRYGTMTAAMKDAQVNANRYAKNNSASLGDKFAAAGAAHLIPGSGLIKGAVGLTSGAVNKVVRKRGTSALAVGADKAADLLKNSPEALGSFAQILRDAAQRGSLPIVHQLLMQKPEYRQIMEGDQ